MSGINTVDNLLGILGVIPGNTLQPALQDEFAGQVEY